MRSSRSLGVLCLFALAGCTSTPADTSLTDELQNPLYAEQYYDALVDHMANLVIQNDSLSQDEATKKIIEKYRTEGMSQVQKIKEKQAEGKEGTIVSDLGYARGGVLLIGHTLYFAPDFDTVPGPDLHLYLSTVLDPRDAAFPDNSAIDIGVIKSAYGAHTYTLDNSIDTSTIRTIALYDRRLNRLYGFAQLAGN